MDVQSSTDRSSIPHSLRVHKQRIDRGAGHHEQPVAVQAAEAQVVKHIDSKALGATGTGASRLS